MLVMDILEKLFARGESEIASSFKKRLNGFDSCDHTHVVDCNSNHLDIYLNVWKIRNIKCMLNYPLVIPASSEPVNALEN